MISIILGQSIHFEEVEKPMRKFLMELSKIAPMYNSNYLFLPTSFSGKSALEKAEKMLKQKKFTVNGRTVKKKDSDFILLVDKKGKITIKKGEFNDVKANLKDIEKCLNFFNKKQKRSLWLEGCNF